MPTSPLGFLIFVFAVAPGLWSELILQRAKTRPKESAFIEVGRVLLASTVISLPALCVAYSLWPVFDSGRPPLIAMLVKADPAYIGDHFWALVKSLAVYEAFSLILCAPLFATIVNLIDLLFVARTSNRYTAWSYAFDHPRKDENEGKREHWWKRKKKKKAFAQIRMQSGDVWAGPIASYTPNHEMIDRELILKAPILYQGGSSSGLAPTHDEVVVLKASEMESIAVLYFLPSDEAGTEPGSQTAPLPADGVTTAAGADAPATAR